MVQKRGKKNLKGNSVQEEVSFDLAIEFCCWGVFLSISIYLFSSEILCCWVCLL